MFIYRETFLSLQFRPENSLYKVMKKPQKVNQLEDFRSVLFIERKNLKFCWKISDFLFSYTIEG
jgi:hypothetical protein